MKKLVIILLTAMSSMAFGAVVAIGGLAPARLGVQAAEGGPLLTGVNSYYLTVGSYWVPPVVTDAASMLAVVSSFIPFSSAGGSAVTVGSAAGGTMGGTFLGQGPTDLAARPIYIFVHNNANYLSSTQVAVLRAISQVFPGDLTSIGSTAVLATLVGVVEVVGDVTDAPAGFDYVTMVAVPEPCTALLGLLGVAGLIRRRR